MKKFIYSLERVLNVRTLEYEQVEAELADVMHLLRERRDALERVIDTLQGVVDAGFETGERLTATWLQHRQAYIDRLKEDICMHDQQVAEAEEKVEECRKRLIDAKLEVEKLSKHREKLHHEWLMELNKEEVRFNDEIGSILDYLKSQDEQ